MGAEDCLEVLKKELEGWYTEQTGTKRVTYIICAGLAILEHMVQSFPLKRDDYVTQGTQVKTGGPLIARILKEHGETRPFTREGARTTRGTLAAAEALVVRFNSCPCAKEVAGLSPQERRERTVRPLQKWIVDHGVASYFARQHLEIKIDTAKPPHQIVSDILKAAGDRRGPVAHHLVGAKLELRFPTQEIRRSSFTTADQPGGLPGDYILNDTAIHVTVAPMVALLEKAEANLKNGYRAKIIVPASQTGAALKLADDFGLGSQVDVSPLEQFVGANVEEVAEFCKEGLESEFRNLLEHYNKRIEDTETDMSLQIDIPANLGKRKK